MSYQNIDRLVRLILVGGLFVSLSISSDPVHAVQANPMGISVDTQIDSNDPAYQACTIAPNDCSLRGAISKANADSGIAYLIDLPIDTYTLTLSGDEDNNAGGDLDIKGNLTIAGAGEESTIIDGSHLDRVFHILSGATTEIHNVKITGGQAPASSDGGGILNSGTLILTNSMISDNSAGNGADGTNWYIPGGNGGNGGGVFNDHLLTINNSSVSDNTAGIGGKSGSFVDGGDGGNGGGIYNVGTLVFTIGSVSRNTAGSSGYSCCDYPGGGEGNGGSGGGVYNIGNLTINQVTISYNSARDGGIQIWSSRARSGDGGGIHNSGVLTLHNSTISDNTTGNGGVMGAVKDCCYGGLPGGSGGGIYNTGSATLSNDTISRNKTGNGGEGDMIYGDEGPGGDGGGIYSNGTLAITNLTIQNNTTGNGGVGTDDANKVLVGSAGSGGGIYSPGGNTLSLTNTSLLGNATGTGITSYGGGIFIESTTIPQWANAIVAGNTTNAGSLGSGIYIKYSSPILLHTTIAQNTGGDGSGIYAVNSNLILMNTILAGQAVGVTADTNSTVTMEATLWGNGDWADQNDTGGSGSITTGSFKYWGNPEFVSPETLNYHIQATSDAIDRGISVVGVTTDIDNQPRPNPDTGIPDIGADEYWITIPVYLPLILNAP